MSNERECLQYEGYYSRFGNTVRPALVRYIEGYDDHQRFIACRFFIDNKTSKEFTYPYRPLGDKPYSIALLSNRNSGDKDVLLPVKFNPSSDEAWICLFEDACRLRQSGDPLAHALVAIAFDKFDWQNDVIRRVFGTLGGEKANIITDMIVSFSWALSTNKIGQIKELTDKCQAVFPVCLAEAAELYGIRYKDFNVHSLTERIINAHRDDAKKQAGGFVHFLNWLTDENITIALQEIDNYYPYLGERGRSLAIKRFFHDIKRGIFTYNDETLEIFYSQNYRYYSQYRYIFNSWPNLRNVSSDFVLDCIKTYISSNQQSFQEYNGILDWAMRKSMELHRPINIRFSDWLSYCEGGVVLNSQFKGFADFEIKYKINDSSFEDDRLRRNIEMLRDRYSTRCYHTELQIYTDPATGEAVVDPNTGRAKTHEVTVWEDRWRVNGNRHSDEYIDLFVNWEKRPATETDTYVFTPEMIDPTIVRSRVERYIQDKYNSLTPYISLGLPHGYVVDLFMSEVAMRAILNPDAGLGVSPGVEYKVVENAVVERLKELFGDTLECDYDQSKLRTALTDTLYRADAKRNECFVVSEKTYQERRRIYCTPVLSERQALLTKRKFAICRNDICFKTCIKKNPKWTEYKLIHLLEIIGYEILEETEAGFIPNKVYSQFGIQINKAVGFYKRLVCRECGHLLFPVKSNPNSPQGLEYNRIMCLSPSCSEHRKPVYLSFCHTCKKGLIDSRDSKTCPNGLHICPECSSCCSNAFFDAQVEKRSRSGLPVPASWAKRIGHGHLERGMIFCHKCGSQKVDVHADGSGRLAGRCPVCEPIEKASV